MIGLVGCCGPKLKHAAPARQLYTSALFKKALAYALRSCEHVYVISAALELVELDQVIEPYEKTMTDLSKEWRIIWGARVWQAIQHRHPAPGREIAFFAGKEYVAPIRRAAHRYPAIDTFIEPLAGMQIGQRLAFLSKPADLPVSPTTSETP